MNIDCTSYARCIGADSVKLRRMLLDRIFATPGVEVGRTFELPASSRRKAHQVLRRREFIDRASLMVFSFFAGAALAFVVLS